MFCMECGTKLPDNAKFCMNCGTKVGQVSAPAAQQAVTEEKPYEVRVPEFDFDFDFDEAFTGKIEYDLPF